MTPKINHVVMLASENAALNDGKIGGIGDVIRDLPPALVNLGLKITVITPSYGLLHKKNPSNYFSNVTFPFKGKIDSGEIWAVKPQNTVNNITYFVFEHPDIRGAPIYYNDPPENAFMRDATKYSLFCSAIGQFIKSFSQPFILHLHDWHTPTILLLGKLHPEFKHLKNIKTIFTIHNLAIQGTRPIRSHISSVETWFPELFQNTQWIDTWRDHRYKEDCYTPMAAGIQFSDIVNTVSPSYAEEILKPSNHQNGYYGGEGLEDILQKIKQKNRLVGILNGCKYPHDRTATKMPFSKLCDLIQAEIHNPEIIQNQPYLTTLSERVQKLKNLNPSIILTCVSRIVEQKVKLFFEKNTEEIVAIEKIMNFLETYNGVFLFLGSGAQDYERQLENTFQAHKRFVFIRGYFDKIAEALYANGNLFLMPSSYEPCGISQMLAMRDGQPCIVHAVGGLKDTVINNINGFSFTGNSIQEKVDNFIKIVEEAIKLYFENNTAWSKISMEAKNSRFTWESSAKKYIELLYNSLP